MAIDPSAVWDFAKEVIGAARPDRGRMLATVTRIDADGTTWVTTGDGGEAPAASAAAGVSVGDTVTLEWDGAAMGIRGNVSNPSPAGSVVRRAVARAQGVADAAQRVADAVNQHFFSDTNGIHVTEATQEEWDASHAGANVLINSVGQLFRDGLNNLLTLTTEGNARALTIWDGLGNAAANVRAVFGEVITLGNASDGSVVTIDSDSMDMVHGTTEMLHFGYGLGTSTSGTANAPYYTVGTRAANSTVGNYSFAEGYLTTASGYSSHAEGVQTTASANISHAEGANTIASGVTSHAEGSSTTASGDTSHAEGVNVTASGYASHAEGVTTTASRYAAHAEGHVTTASGYYSHAEGYGTTASGSYSHAQNRGTVAAHDDQTVIGRYNDDSSSGYALEIGNGTDDSNRSNAFAVDWYGDVEAAGTVVARGRVTAATDAVFAALIATDAGSVGISGDDTWVIRRDVNYGLVLGSGAADHLYSRASTVTVNTANVTQSGDNNCWNNGAVCSFVYRCAVKSALANGSELAVGTLPADYRPPCDMAVEVYTSTAVRVNAKVGMNGTITVKNVSGSSLATSVLLRISGTWAF